MGVTCGSAVLAIGLFGVVVGVVALAVAVFRLIVQRRLRANARLIVRVSLHRVHAVLPK